MQFPLLLLALASPVIAQLDGISEVTNCQGGGAGQSNQTCTAGSLTVSVTAGGRLGATSYTQCHDHGGVELHCSGDGIDTTLALAASASSASSATTPTSTSSSSASTATSAALSTITEVTGCHLHGSAQFCVAGAAGELEVVSGKVDGATGYTGCHAHGSTELHCSGSGSNTYDVTLHLEGAESNEAGHEHEEASAGTTSPITGVVDLNNLPAGVSCHEHSGVPHCVDSEGRTVEIGCARIENEYNIPLRIGALFAVLATSAIGVLLPIILVRFAKLNHDNILFIIIRQFGTGVVISTAVVHLFTHAQLYFSSPCVTGITYEATAGALLMAGLFITFLIDYFAKRFLGSREHSHSPVVVKHDIQDNREGASSTSSDVEAAAATASGEKKMSSLGVLTLEAGLIFHSILIGITLVVASTTFHILFPVIIFHQVFEGLALGARLAALSHKSLLTKILLAMAFAITTPIGMAIGIGVLSSFNGNDSNTLIAIGTINAISAGILLWVGVVDMWYHEWYGNGSLANAGIVRVGAGLISLIAGLVLMSFLGKWA